MNTTTHTNEEIANYAITTATAALAGDIGASQAADMDEILSDGRQLLHMVENGQDCQSAADDLVELMNCRC